MAINRICSNDANCVNMSPTSIKDRKRFAIRLYVLLIRLLCNYSAYYYYECYTTNTFLFEVDHSKQSTNTKNKPILQCRCVELELTTAKMIITRQHILLFFSNSGGKCSNSFYRILKHKSKCHNIGFCIPFAHTNS